MGLEFEPSSDVSGRTRSILSTLARIFFNILVGYSDFSKAEHSSFTLKRLLLFMIHLERKHWEYMIPEKTCLDANY